MVIVDIRMNYRMNYTYSLTGSLELALHGIIRHYTAIYWRSPVSSHYKTQAVNCRKWKWYKYEWYKDEWYKDECVVVVVMVGVGYVSFRVRCSG